MVWQNQSFTYDWLGQEIASWSAEFASRPNTRPGTVVALSADYSPTATAILLALLGNGCIVALSTAAPAWQKPDLLRLAEVETEIVVDGAGHVTIVEVGHKVSHALLASLSSGRTGGLVLFTSGSAGKVKAVVHDGARLLSKYRKSGRARATIPFMLFDHIGGINTLLHVLSSGGTAVFASDREPKTICELIERERVQVLPTTPTFLNLLLLSDYQRYDLSSLDTIAYGAERMPAWLLERVGEAFPGVRLVQNYGLSEIGILQTSSEANGSLFMKLGGDGIETRVRNGLLEIKSDSAMLGYLNEASPFTEDGWFKTGDRVEVQGEYHRVLGRASDVINVGGEKVYPAEIEDLIQSMPDVIQVIVSAEPNAITGQIVRAEVRLSSDESRDAFRTRMTNFLDNKLPPFKIPQRITLSAVPLQSERLKLRRNPVPAYERVVSLTDRGFIARDSLLSPNVIQLVVEGAGNLAPDSLREALKRTTHANPGSSLVLDEAGTTLCWRSGPSPQLTIVDAPDFDATSELNAPFLLSRLDARAGPSCNVLLVRGQKHIYLIFRALHAVMDGRGVLGWARDFMRCLRGEDPAGHQSTTNIDQLVREVGTSKRPHPLPDALHPFGPANSDNSKGGFCWRRVTVHRPLDSRMSGRIAVALAHRARSAGVEGTVRLNLPADLRHYRPNERITGNFFSSLHIEVPKDASADDVSFRIVQGLYTHESTKAEGLYTSDSAASLAAFRVKLFFDIARIDESGRYKYSATLSNLGAIEGADFSSPDFLATSAFFIPAESDSGCVVSFNGFGQDTVAAVGLSDRFSGNGNLDAFVALVRSAIEGTARQMPNTGE